MSQQLRVRTYLGIDSGFRDSPWGHGHGIPSSPEGRWHYACLTIRQLFIMFAKSDFSGLDHAVTRAIPTYPRVGRGPWRDCSGHRIGLDPRDRYPFDMSRCVLLAFVSDSFDMSHHVFFLGIRPIWYQSFCVLTSVSDPFDISRYVFLASVSDPVDIGRYVFLASSSDPFDMSRCVFSLCIRSNWYQSFCVLASLADSFDISRCVLLAFVSDPFDISRSVF